MPRLTTFWDRCTQAPPILVRLLARHPRGAPLTNIEIADRSKLSVYEVTTISNCPDWSCADLPAARQFMLGCGIDLASHADWRRIQAYLRSSPTWQYLRKSPHWRSYFQPLMMCYRQSVISKLKATK